LARKLKSKGFDEAAIADALGAVASLGLQSDGRFLEAFVRGQFAKGRGPWRIGQEARLKGMDAEGLAECLADYDWDAALARIHDKKFGAAAPADRKDYAARVRFLSQRGFEPDRIQALLRRLGRGGDEF
jgi:regulatory protein